MDRENLETDARELALTDVCGCIGIITMNDARRLNCLSSELVSTILLGLDTLEKASVRVVILRAPAGSKVWCAGHNIKEIPLDGDDPLTWNVPFEKLLHRVRNFPVPVMGMVEGSVWGGACDLAMTCDVLVGTHSSTFAITPAESVFHTMQPGSRTSWVCCPSTL